MVSVFATWRLTENETPKFGKTGTGGATEKRRPCAKRREMQQKLSGSATLAARFLTISRPGLADAARIC
jgi:hypothetical protein